MAHLCGIRQIDEPFTEAKRDMEAPNPARPAKPHTEHAQADPGFYLAQKHHKCARKDPSRYDTGGRTTSVSDTRREGNCPKVTAAENHEPLREIVGDRATIDTTNCRWPQPEEKATPWNAAAAYRPSKGDSVAGWTARHPVAMPKEHGRYTHSHKDGMSGAPVAPRNKPHPLIASDPTEYASENDETTQRAIPHLAENTLEIGSASGTEVKEWRYGDRLSLRHGVAMSPARHRQAVVDILGVADRKDRVFRPKAGKDFAENAKSRQVATRPYSRERTAASRRNASIGRSREDVRRWVNGPARRSHREAGHTESGTEAPKRIPYEAPRKVNPLHVAYAKARERPPLKRDREGTRHLYNTHGSRVTSGRDRKPAYSQGSAWGARGKARSADPNSPNTNPANKGTRTRKASPLGSQHGHHETQDCVAPVKPSEGKHVDVPTSSP